MEKVVMHKHDSVTGGHVCGSKVPRWAKESSSWILEGTVVGEKEDRSEDYLGSGVWCCTLHKKEVTCPECLKKMREEEVFRNTLRRRFSTKGYKPERQIIIATKRLSGVFTRDTSGGLGEAESYETDSGLSD